MSKNPAGIILYTPDGYMPVQLMHLGRTLNRMKTKRLPLPFLLYKHKTGMNDNIMIVS